MYANGAMTNLVFCSKCGNRMIIDIASISYRFDVQDGSEVRIAKLHCPAAKGLFGGGHARYIGEYQNGRFTQGITKETL